MEKPKKKFRELFYNNRFLFSFSILCALVIWVIASINTSSDKEEIIEDVPIIYDLNDSVPQQYGLEIFGPKTATVNVKIIGKRHIVGSITKDDLLVYPRLNTIIRAGQNNAIQLICQKKSEDKDFKIVESDPGIVSLAFDTPLEKWIALKPDIDYSGPGKIVEEGYLPDPGVLSVKEVKVSGASSSINSISKIVARCKIDKPLSKTAVLPVEIIALDQNGNTPDNISIELGETPIEITIPVLKRKPIAPRVSFINAPQYYVSAPLSYVCTPSILELAGSEEEINRLYNYFVNIDFKELSFDKRTFMFPIELPAGVRTIDDTKNIEVTVQMSGLIPRYFNSIPKENISLINSPPGMECTLKSGSIREVKMIVPVTISDQITSADVFAEVDLSNTQLPVGEQTVEARIYVRGHDDCWAYDVYNVVINVSEKPPETIRA